MGVALVSGRRREPSPAAGITALRIVGFAGIGSSFRRWTGAAPAGGAPSDATNAPRAPSLAARAAHRCGQEQRKEPVYFVTAK
ncbi:hypothetical protein GCM10010260_81780 [Streptomyces filipinensis]|uniref:Uncharacterized protein n=1 Tax=Streptomyces filipinensis TaxID=66887 RepID=A0A918IKV9_9ACTN|nr:hypothetical protein GCM10010260_81780 [Streptomyces filipinensis]